MSLAELLAFPTHRRIKSAPGALDERLDLVQAVPQSKAAASRRRGSVAGPPPRRVGNPANLPANNKPSGPAVHEGGAAKENVPETTTTALRPPVGGPAVSVVGGRAAAPSSGLRTRRRGRGRHRNNAAHHDRSFTIATSLRLPPLDPGMAERGAPSEQPLLLYTARRRGGTGSPTHATASGTCSSSSSPSHSSSPSSSSSSFSTTTSPRSPPSPSSAASSSGARLGGLTIVHAEDGSADVFFNDKHGNIYQAPSAHDRDLDTMLMRTFAKMSGRPSGMAGVRTGADGDQVRLLVADRLRKAIVVAGENTFDVMVDRVTRPMPAAMAAEAVATAGLLDSDGAPVATHSSGRASPRRPRGSKGGSPRGASPRVATATSPRGSLTSPRAAGATRSPRSPRSPRRQPFLAPSCVLPDAAGNVFFADAGALRECAAGNLAGSVYVAEAPPAGAPAGTPPTVRPIIDGGLAYPSAMAWLRTDDLLICESFLNRVLRATRDPASGAWSVRLFARFQQRFGPTGIAVRRNPRGSSVRERCGGDKFSVFVAHSALPKRKAASTAVGGGGGAECDDHDEACVLRLTPKGAVAEEYALPGVRCVTSMALRSADSMLVTAADQLLQLDV